MSRFEDHLWREVVREHGDSLTQTSTPRAKRPAWRRLRLVAGTSLGLAAAGTALVLALVLGATTTSPAFAVTRNHDGTVTVSIKRPSGDAGANAKLKRLGIRAQVLPQAPVDCGAGTSMAGQGAPAPKGRVTGVHWTINPHKIPAGRKLVLTPPGPPPAGNSGDSASTGTATGGESQVAVPPGNSASSGATGETWSCPPTPMQGQGAPAPGAGNSRNSATTTG
ncbi:MAG: hypothetical protein ACRDL5_00830 [Solirubrobacteraceae bacterium]